MREIEPLSTWSALNTPKLFISLYRKTNQNTHSHAKWPNFISYLGTFDQHTLLFFPKQTFKLLEFYIHTDFSMKVFSLLDEAYFSKLSTGTSVCKNYYREIFVSSNSKLKNSLQFSTLFICYMCKINNRKERQ